MAAKKQLNILKKKIIPILKKNHVVRAGIFGSYACGEQKKDSDVDILIEFNDSLLTLVRIERELKENLGKKVDLLTYKGIHPLLKERILKEEVRII
ncbi:MAG: nucleotidyltransferase family protein [Nanoarchaeota archaeon]|nr:nucleotidyltransferase family protein [Nanoarchaeota archaeon]MBU4284366.1 nucleotidyltransferase family protein [Nanoarchaeota archaeon]MBU4493196.1 nucleotidyltransferase family protein [Nanoarchaeota archaeon]